jgi:hypothetical protein
MDRPDPSKRGTLGEEPWSGRTLGLKPKRKEIFLFASEIFIQVEIDR